METIKDSYKKLHGLDNIGKGLDHKDSKTIEWAENLIAEQSTSQQQTIERLREALQNVTSSLIAHIGRERAKEWLEVQQAEQLLNTTEPSGNYYCTEVYKKGFYCEEQCERCKKVDPLTEPIDQ